jgi:hypothetical protein
MKNRKDFLAFLILCVVAIQSGWLSIDDFNIRFSNILANVLRSEFLRLRMIPGNKCEFPRKKPKNLINWWDLPYYKDSKLKVPEQKRIRKPKKVKWGVDNAGTGERKYLGYQVLPPDLGIEL